MKIIISRKGFDLSNGGNPSPILPDGTLLSMPIPSEDDLSYSDLCYDGVTYSEILRQLSSKKQYEKYDKCHLDPDIRVNARVNTVPNWEPIFGQTDKRESYLRNNQVGSGDLFLFFGMFRKTVGDISKGTLHYVKNAPSLHVIYGYMQVDKTITEDKNEFKKYDWHPHTQGELLNSKNNTLYLPTKTLSFDKRHKGWGVFDYSEKRVLTLDRKKATWHEIPALMPDNISGDRKNSAKGFGIYYQGVWQEIVLKENNISEEWAKSVFDL